MEGEEYQDVTALVLLIVLRTDPCVSPFTTVRYTRG
jgi:hypothetical protein